jgi:hypothetical protein
MSASPAERIDAIVRLALANESAFDQMVALAASHPEQIVDLAVVLMQHRGRKQSIDFVLPHMPYDRWPGLVDAAVDRLDQCEGDNPTAVAILEVACDECPSALHSHLDRLFRLSESFPSQVAACEPWRESGDRHFEFLRRVFETQTASDDERWLAFFALLQTRDPKLLAYAKSRARAHEVLSHGGGDAWRCLDYFGYHQEDTLQHPPTEGTIRRICPEATYHLQFPVGFLEPGGPKGLVHPTWKLQDLVQTVDFGGSSDGLCGLCGEHLHRWLLLDAIPPGLGVTGLERLELATCLSCLGWEKPELFYQHSRQGLPLSVGYAGPRVKPRSPVGPLMRVQLGLARTPSRWVWQSWRFEQNLHRLGGEPIWVQDTAYPVCPLCSRVMPFLLQLGAFLPMEDGGEWDWCDAGIGYGFWCDGCKVSGFLWQC